MERTNYSEEQLRFLRLLAESYPSVISASARITELKTVLGLPKGTEHFISDIHGENEAFDHIMNSWSGVIREKIDSLFGNAMSRAERDALATLIYYPAQKMKGMDVNAPDSEEWFRLTIYRLFTIMQTVTAKYSRSNVRKALPKEFSFVMDELLHMSALEETKQSYYDNIIASIIASGVAPQFVIAVCDVIKSMAVESLHVVGDIFDRGPRADKVMDRIMACREVDIQWGNHDILWMGAACGSRTLVATVVANSIHYNNLSVLETGYGISLRPLSVFANEVYADCDLHRFKVSLVEADARVTEKDKLLSARMHKAITIILFKLEGQKLIRHPEFGMGDRLLLDKIDYAKKTVRIGDVDYPLEDCDFPTVDPENPYALTEDESGVIEQLVDSFRHSRKLQEHVRFLYANGSIYKTCNGNLLLHGAVPMTEDGEFMHFNIGGKDRAGKAFFDYADRVARKAYYDPVGSEARQQGMDFMWFLWGGRNSPIFGRAQLTTFERRLIADESTWTEAKNAYYTLYENPEMCDRILKEFGLEGKHCHIINGHVPVKVRKGESPVKGGGKLLVIDGGFCKAYQKTSGIAGYTLIFNSHCMRIVAHQPFVGKKEAIEHNLDITNETQVFETMEQRLRIADTDAGREMQKKIDELSMLVEAYKTGAVPEHGDWRVGG